MSSTPQSQIPSSRRTIADALQHAMRTSVPRQPGSDDVIRQAAVTEQIELAPFLRAQPTTRRWNMASLSGRARLLILVLVAAIAAAPWVWAGIQPDASPDNAASVPSIMSTESTSVLQTTPKAQRVTSSRRVGKLVPGTGPVAKPARHARRHQPAASNRVAVPHAVQHASSPRSHSSSPAYRSPAPGPNPHQSGGEPIELVPVM